MALSSTGAALIVGSGVTTISAVYGLIGYVARRFLTQQQANHADTLEALTIAKDIQQQMPALGRKIKRLERGRKENARNIDHLARLMEIESTRWVDPPPKTAARPAVARR